MELKEQNRRRSQGGFTLIEIIAVLVILGILAAVAVPKFLDLQDEARKKSLEGLVAAAQSQLSMEYARLILSHSNEGDAWGDLPGTVCDQVTMDGFPTGTTLGCTAGTNVINISAQTGSLTASGEFSRPQ